MSGKVGKGKPKSKLNKSAKKKAGKSGPIRSLKKPSAAPF